MRLRLSLLAFFLCAMAAVTKASPQEAPVEKPPASTAAAPAVERLKIDPEKEASLRELVEVMGLRSEMVQTLDKITEGQKPSLMRSLPPGEYRAQLVDLFFEKFRSKLSADLMIGITVSAYDKYFSNAEIKGLIQFYQTPLGRKTVTVLPDVITEIFQKGEELGRRLGQESMREVLNEHPDLKASLQAAYAAAPAAPGGVSGGIPGGVAGGVQGGVPAPPPPPPPPPPLPADGSMRIRVSAAVQEARLTSKTFPVYPPLARQARIQGTVELQAIIGKDGTIEELKAVSGPPLLIPAAMDAVKQWRYEPTLLEGQPVLVETYIDVIFTLGEPPPKPN